jgi:hypothetical protein
MEPQPARHGMPMAPGYLTITQEGTETPIASGGKAAPGQWMTYTTIMETPCFVQGVTTDTRGLCVTKRDTARLAQSDTGVLDEGRRNGGSETPGINEVATFPL